MDGSLAPPNLSMPLHYYRRPTLIVAFRQVLGKENVTFLR